MKKHSIVAVIILLTQLCFSQNIQEIDSVSKKMCASLAELNHLEDKIKVQTVFQEHLSQYFKKLNVESQYAADSISNNFYFRMQKTCKVFADILNRLEENKSDWKTLSEKPKSVITESDMSSFLNHTEYFYKEYNGEIVSVNISKGFWKESFSDGSYSILKFELKTNGEFDLVFISSNNETRKNLSVAGEIFHYGLISQNSNTFDIWVNVNATNDYTSFKLYRK